LQDTSEINYSGREGSDSRRGHNTRIDYRLSADNPERFGPISLAQAMPCWTAFPASSDTFFGIMMLVYIDLFLVRACLNQRTQYLRIPQMQTEGPYRQPSSINQALFW
jgi:hypothetical protein